MAEFEARYRIRFHDVDHAGIVFFAAIQRYCHDAMEDMQRDAGIPLESFFDEHGIGAPLVDVHARYHRPYRHGERLRIRVGIEKIGESSVVTRYRCLDETDTLRAEVRTVQVFIDSETFESIRVPDIVRNALEPLLLGSG